MADNNSVLTIVLVVAAFLLLSGNLTGNQIRNAPGVASREEFGRPAGSQIADICYSEAFRTEIADGDSKVGAVPGGGYLVHACRQGVLRAYFCPKDPLSTGGHKAYGNTQQYTTDQYDIACTPIAVSNTIFQESSL